MSGFPSWSWQASQPSDHFDPVSQNRASLLLNIPPIDDPFFRTAAKAKACVTCRKASPSPLPACWARTISFLLFSFLLWMLKRQDSRHTSSMKAMRPSMERMATVRGGSLWAAGQNKSVSQCWTVASGLVLPCALIIPERTAFTNHWEGYGLTLVVTADVFRMFWWYILQHDWISYWFVFYLVSFTEKHELLFECWSCTKNRKLSRKPRPRFAWRENCGLILCIDCKRNITLSH